MNYHEALSSSPIFPYEVSLDQLAYMSCSEQEDVPNDGTFFTFRLGAFDSQGLRISQAYRDHITKVSQKDVPFVLSQAQASANTQLQMAIRTQDNLQLMYLDNSHGESGLDGHDYSNFFPLMGHADLNEILWFMQPRDYLRSFLDGPLSREYRFEGELLFMKSQLMENDLRSFFSRQRGIIAATFVEQGTTQPLGPGSLVELQRLAESGFGGGRLLLSDSGLNGGEARGVSGRPWNEASKDLTANVFGAAIRPRFKQPLHNGGSPGSDMPPRILSSVTDVTIDFRLQAQAQRPWVCPEIMSFMVVLPEHATYEEEAEDGSGPVTTTRCGMEPDPVNPSLALRIIRQSLYAEDFYVDMIRGCVVPKSDHTVDGSCYGQNSHNNQTHPVNYETFSTEGCGLDNAKGVCPHYVSICYRE